VINSGLKAHQAHHTWASGSLEINYASVSHEIITFTRKLKEKLNKKGNFMSEIRNARNKLN
jgi:hypothetical protein